ncbi:bacterial transferase hexapeptide repeat protein, partial [Teladorsagia circumcincta]
ERRAENKNNVMTLIYSDSKAAKNAVVAVEKSTKKLKAYHRKEEPAQLDIDKSFFIGDAVIRQDIVDSPKTHIYNCIIGDNCVIGANCRLEESVLGDNVSISDGTHVQKQSVISAK